MTAVPSATLDSAAEGKREGQGRWDGAMCMLGDALLLHGARCWGWINASVGRSLRPEGGRRDDGGDVALGCWTLTWAP